MATLQKSVDGKLRTKTNVFNITVTIQSDGRYLIEITAFYIFKISFTI